MNRLIALAVLMLDAVCVFGAFYVFHERQSFLRQAEMTRGTVIQGGAGGGPFRPGPEAVVRCTLRDGATREFKVDTLLPVPKGREAAIAYLPNAPGQARLVSPAETWLPVVFLLGLGVPMGAAAIWMLLKTLGIADSAMAPRGYRAPWERRNAATPSTPPACPGERVVVRNFRHVEYVDPETGRRRVLGPNDPIPADLQARLDAIRGQYEAQGGGTVTRASYTYRDEAGREITYDSLDDMPPELRRIFEQARRNPDRPG